MCLFGSTRAFVIVLYCYVFYLLFTHFKISFTTLVEDQCSSKVLNDYKRKRGGFKSAYFKSDRFYTRNI